MAIGSATSMRAKLLAFWSVLFLCRKMNIMDVHIVGDSKVVIDWYNKKAELNVMSLQPWKDRIKELGSSFTSLQIFHIHRIYNTTTDFLSKAGLSSDVGILKVEEYNGIEKLSSWALHIF